MQRSLFLKSPPLIPLMNGDTDLNNKTSIWLPSRNQKAEFPPLCGGFRVGTKKEAYR